MNIPVKHTIFYLTLLCMTTLTLPAAFAGGNHPLVGKKAPELNADHAFNGEVVNLSSLLGKVVLVDFWAVYCGPCKATLPWIRDLHKSYRNKGLEVIGVTTYFPSFAFDKESGIVKKLSNDQTVKPEDQRVMLKDFASHNKLKYRQLILDEDAWKKASQQFGVKSIPMVYLIDKLGNVRGVFNGSEEINSDDLEEKIGTLLKEQQ